MNASLNTARSDNGATPFISALILAAGRGERMRPLTDSTPKPLLQVRGKPLIEWHIEALVRSGVQKIVINTAWLEDQFEPLLGDGSRWNIELLYSHEGRDHGGALETAGGMAKALPLLASSLDEAFWVVSGDVFLPQFDFSHQDWQSFQNSEDWAHLWLVNNAPHHPQGDFGITVGGKASKIVSPRYTWASVGLFKGRLVESLVPGTKAALRAFLERGIDLNRISASFYEGSWTDVGTVERLNGLNIESVN